MENIVENLVVHVLYYAPKGRTPLANLTFINSLSEWQENGYSELFNFKYKDYFEIDIHTDLRYIVNEGFSSLRDLVRDKIEECTGEYVEIFYVETSFSGEEEQTIEEPGMHFFSKDYIYVFCLGFAGNSIEEYLEK